MSVHEEKSESQPTIAATVTYKPNTVVISQHNVVVETITYQIAKNVNFNPVAANFFSWQGHGGGTGITAPGGSNFNVSFAGAWKSMNLAAGTYYIRAAYAYRVSGGATQFHYGPVETFTV